MCTLQNTSVIVDDSNGFKYWIQPSLPENLSDDLRFMFRR